MARKTETLPPGVERRDGRLVRVLIRTAADGTTHERIRQVADTLEEARARRHDYYHPTLGWMLEGHKLERDRPEEDIMADTSVSAGTAPEDNGDEQGDEDPDKSDEDPDGENDPDGEEDESEVNSDG